MLRMPIASFVFYVVSYSLRPSHLVVDAMTDLPRGVALSRKLLGLDFCVESFSVGEKVIRQPANGRT